MPKGGSCVTYKGKITSRCTMHPLNSYNPTIGVGVHDWANDEDH